MYQLCMSMRLGQSPLFGMIGRHRRVWSQINLICLGDAKNAEASVPTSGGGAFYVETILCDDGRRRPPLTRPGICGRGRGGQLR